MEFVGTDSLVVSALTYSTTVSGDACSIPGLRSFADQIALSPPHTNLYTVLCDKHKKAKRKKKLHLQISEFYFTVTWLLL